MKTVAKLLAPVIFIILSTTYGFCQLKKWDGGAGDGQWITAANWAGDILPSATDDVLLDNSILSGNYTVTLPTGIATINVKSLTIMPVAATSIEVILPASNTASPAFVASGPGYGLLINAGGIFRNSSGATAGITVGVADSLRIANDGKYVHQTIGAHAALVNVLSRSAGTESGVFEFNTPSASATISLSGRTYGKLLLSSDAHGGAVTYSGNGVNPLTINSDLEIGTGVTLSISFANTVSVKRNYIQNGGQFNIANSSAATRLAIYGDMIQSAGTITESGTAIPQIVLAGSSNQNINVKGSIVNSIRFEINNATGATLANALILPYALYLTSGILTTTSSTLLTLQSGCSIVADSLSNNSFINGPMKKEGLNGIGYFLFPVGKGNTQRWLELRNASGDFTVEFFKSNPQSFSTTTGAGINHISAIEYWSVSSNGTIANVELSFDNVNSGGVTSLGDLRVARLLGGIWTDAGNTGSTGSAGSNGSVISSAINDFTGPVFTLASSASNQNPLPAVYFSLNGDRDEEKVRLEWISDPDLDVTAFEIESSGDGLHFRTIGKLSSCMECREFLFESNNSGQPYYRIRALAKNGNFFYSDVLQLDAISGSAELKKLYPSATSGIINVEIKSDTQRTFELRILDISGRLVARKVFITSAGNHVIFIPVYHLRPGLYHIFGVSSALRTNTLRFVKN